MWKQLLTSATLVFTLSACGTSNVPQIIEEPEGGAPLVFVKTVNYEVPVINGVGNRVAKETYVLQVMRNKGETYGDFLSLLESFGWSYNVTAENIKNAALYCSAFPDLFHDDMRWLSMATCNSTKIGTQIMVKSYESPLVERQIEQFIRVHEFRSRGQ